jgi:saccharopine dehydrogenase-like NADP-dependent oxidoreductase
MSENSVHAPLRVVLVGGAGAMGRWAARSIARLGSASELLIADINLPVAAQLAEEVGGPCRAIQLDATDATAMREVFRDCDVVLNTMGPFSLFARAILDAAIDCGCDYLDIDDDWQSTVEAEEFDAAAREKGVRVIKGIGGSPGVSNLLAVAATQRLDRVTEIMTGWSMRGAVLVDEPGYPAPAAAGAAVEHWLLQMTGTIRGWREGGPADTMPVIPVDFEYPGIGPVRGYTVGHPEAVTLPRNIAGVITAMNVNSGPAWLFENARSVADSYGAGHITLQEGAGLLAHAQRPEGAPSSRDPLSAVWALARGTRGEETVSVSVSLRSPAVGKMGGGTGSALAVGLELLRRGAITEVGVHAPEAAIDPESFFELYSLFVETPVPAAELLEIHESTGTPAPVEGSGDQLAVTV